MVKRNILHEYIFNDYPEFKPNLSPSEIFHAGAFGGTYWRKIYSNITKQYYENQHKKYPKSWFNGLKDDYLTLPYEKYNKSINLYNVKVGSSLEDWEDSGWISASAPYGWMQWYCNFFIGERSEDDERQIKRWLGIASDKGRFKLALINEIYKQNGKYNDYDISPAKRQTLLHWGYELTQHDFSLNKN